MPEKILYEFHGFRVDPIKQQLFFDDALVSLPTRDFDLLLVFVQNPNRDFSRDELIQRLWKGAFVDPRTFDVHLYTVRKALGEPKRKPRYIIRTSDGYRLAAEVREVISEDETGKEAAAASTGILDVIGVGRSAKSESLTFIPIKHTAHTYVSCSLYAALYAAAVPLEVAYRFERFGRTALKITPLVFVTMFISSVVALALSRKLILKEKATAGLAVSILILLVAAALLLAALSFFLPNYPITESSFQTYPAQAAYLKDESYFLILAVFFLVIPFHFVATMERETENGNHRAVFSLITGNRLIAAPNGAPYLRVWMLAGLLLVFLIMSVAMTARLLDNLKPSQYQNLFVMLVYLRGLLFFGLGIECVIWYYRSLENLKTLSLPVDA